MKFTPTAVAIATLLASAAAMAAPGNPGTPSAPVTVFTEDFENGPMPDEASIIQRITDYVGASGQRYRADGAAEAGGTNTGWTSACNGWVAAQAHGNHAAARAAQIADCNGVGSWNSARSISELLGTHGGHPNPAQNYAVTAYTAGNPGANLIEFETVDNIPLPQAGGRFLSFSVDVAAMNCFATHPLLHFYLLDDASAETAVGAQIDGCGGASTGSRTDTYTTDSAVLMTGHSVGIRMRNAQGSGTGNDHGFDNIRILDTTPQLDKAYGPTQLNPGETSTLTITITNTDELGEKTGWNFAETLPPGLTINSPIGGTCATAPTVAGNVVTVTGGTLPRGATSCTYTIPVTSATAARYTSPAAATSGTLGLNAPAATSVTFGTPAPTPVPTMGEWGLMLTGSALAMLALRRRRNDA